MSSFSRNILLTRKGDQGVWKISSLNYFLFNIFLNIMTFTLKSDEWNFDF